MTLIGSAATTDPPGASIAFGCRAGAGDAHIVVEQHGIGADTLASAPSAQQPMEASRARSAAAGESIARTSTSAIPCFINPSDVAIAFICSRLECTGFSAGPWVSPAPDRRHGVRMVQQVPLLFGVVLDDGAIEA